MAISEAQVRAVTKYVKTHCRQFVLRCNNEKDADIIEYLEGCDNVTAELKQLIRDKIAKS